MTLLEAIQTLYKKPLKKEDRLSLQAIEACHRISTTGDQTYILPNYLTTLERITPRYVQGTWKIAGEGKAIKLEFTPGDETNG